MDIHTHTQSDIYPYIPGVSDSKESDWNARDPVWRRRRSSGKGNGYPLQCCCLENSWTEEPGELQSMWSQRFGQD